VGLPHICFKRGASIGDDVHDNLGAVLWSGGETFVTRKRRGGGVGADRDWVERTVTQYNQPAAVKVESKVPRTKGTIGDSQRRYNFK